MASSLKSQTTVGVLWSVVERFSLQGVQFVIGIVMARLLAPSDYGLIGMLAIFMSISQVFIDGGMASALIQRQDRTEKDFSTVFYLNISISTLLYVLLFLTAPFIAAFYEQPLLEDITRIYALNLIINSVIAVNKTKLTIAVDFKTLSKISVTSAILSGCIGIFFAYHGFAVWALVIQALVSSLLNVLLTFYYVRWFPRLGFSGDSFRQLFGFGSKLLVASLISSVYVNLYNLFIGKRFNSDSLGYYTRASQFVQFFSTNISGVLSRVSFPVLSQVQDDNQRLVSIYSRYMKVAAFLVFPLILGLCGIARPLVYLLLTEKWAPCIGLIQILCFAHLWDTMITTNLNLLYVKGRSDLTLKLEIIKKSIAFTILFVSMFFSLEVVCLGQVCYGCIAFYLNTYYTRKLLNYGFGQQLREVLPYLLLALVVLAQGLACSQFIESPAWAIGTALVTGSVSYLAVSYLLNLSALRELLSLLHSRGKA